jgi:hypothetical protein
MRTNDVDDFVLFENVRVLRSTPPALLCRVGRRRVWLPRGHISGRLWCVGDRGKLLVRRWLARDRRLIDQREVPTVAPFASVRRPSSLPAALHLVRARNATDAS